MPPLISKWNALADDNPELFPLLESLSSVAMAMGPGFFPFAAPVFERSVRIIANTLVQLQEYEHLRRVCLVFWGWWWFVSFKIILAWPKGGPRAAREARQGFCDCVVGHAERSRRGSWIVHRVARSRLQPSPPQLDPPMPSGSFQKEEDRCS